MFRRRPPFVIPTILVCALVALVVAPIRADDNAAEKLPRDPNNVYGRYDNGVSYIIRKNATPPGRVSVWLHVKTGSINETDAQNGLAHFIEHMAFNGSAHFKPGELIPLMNKLGMVFGADSNAHTTLWETVYKFNLPDTKPETLDVGMNILSDVASSLTLSDAEIESERKVILEESRTRKSAEERIHKQLMKTIFAGTKLERHDVIGDEEQIKSFPRAEFVDYWNTWYRPENVTLIVVGDVDPQQIVELGRAKLGTFTARAAAREPQKAGLHPFAAPRALIFSDPEQVGGEMTLAALGDARPPVTTFEQFRQESLENFGEWIVNRRLGDLIARGGAPFRSARVDSRDLLHEAQDVNATAEGEPQDWNKMLDALVAEVGRAIDYGFTPTELELAKRGTLAGAEEAVRTESTRDTTGIVAMLAGAVGRETPIMSAQQRLELTKRVCDSVTVDQIHDAFVKNFKRENYAYVLTVPSNKDGFTAPSEGEILAAAKAAWAKKTKPPEETKLATALLATEPVPGKVVNKETDADLNITTGEFANGVVFHHKSLDTKKDSVSIKITLPGGRLEETAENRGISEVASLMFARPATSRFSSTQLNDLMTGKNVGVSGDIGTDTLSVNVSGSKADIDAGMRLAYALLTDGVVEQSAMDDWAKRQRQAIEQRRKMPEGRLAEATAEVVYANDPRMKPLTEADVSRLATQRPAAEAWAKHITGSAAIEVTVVGDISLEDAIATLSKYVGSLPQRTGKFDALDRFRKLDRGPGPYAKTVRFDSVTPKAIVMAGVVSCDELDPVRRPLSLASQILSDRMNDRIREKEQLVYSIGCMNRPGSAIPGTGMMMAFAPTDPQNADKLGATIVEMLKDFAQGGPTEEELGIAKKQRVQELSREMTQPRFWLTQLDGMRYRNRPLADLKGLPGVFETYSVKDVRDAVARFAKDDAVIRIEIVPETKTAPPTTKPAEKVSMGG